MVHQFELDGAVVQVEGSPLPVADDLLRRVAGRILEVEPHRLSVRRSCPHCGSSEHGRPFVASGTLPDPRCGLSFSRTDGYAVAAARLNSRIGVDIESITAVSLHPMDDLLLHPVERTTFQELAGDSARRYLTKLWVAKEAVAKLIGGGLRIDLRELHVECDGAKGRTSSWPEGLDLSAAPRLSFFEVSEDVLGALAVSD